MSGWSVGHRPASDMDTTKNGQDVLCDADSVQHQPVVSQYRKASVRYTMQVELSSSSGLVSSQPQPYSYMVEQPAKCGVRFRYECEGRISSAIPGASSSTARFTYPTIAVANYAGPVKVIVSCVTKSMSATLYYNDPLFICMTTSYV